MIMQFVSVLRKQSTTLFSAEMFFQWVITGEVISSIIDCSLAVDVGSSCSSVYYRSHIFKNLEKCIWSLQFCSYTYFGHIMFSGFILILHYSLMWVMGIIDEFIGLYTHLLQFSSVAQLCLTLCKPMNCSTPGFPVHHQLPEFTQTHVHCVSNDIQPSHPLSSPSPPAFNLSQHQGLFQWVSSSYQVAKILEFQLQHQSFQ